MALYIPQSILHLARSLYVRPETYGPNYLYIYIYIYIKNGNCYVIYWRSSKVLMCTEFDCAKPAFVKVLSVFPTTVADMIVTN